MSMIYFRKFFFSEILFNNHYEAYITSKNILKKKGEILALKFEVLCGSYGVTVTSFSQVQKNAIL